MHKSSKTIANGRHICFYIQYLFSKKHLSYQLRAAFKKQPLQCLQDKFGFFFFPEDRIEIYNEQGLFRIF